MIEVSREARAQLAPTGVIRAAINVGNPAAVRVSQSGDLSGPCIDLAFGLGAAVDHRVELIQFPTAAEVIAADESWDIAFLAIDPARGARLHFSPPYMTIECAYAVRANSAINSVEAVDSAGVAIVTAKDSAYDLHLKRTLKCAQRRPFENPKASFDAFTTGDYDVVAGVRQALEQRFGGDLRMRLLPSAMLTIRHAMAVPVSRRAAAGIVDHYVAQAIAQPKHPDT